MGRLWFFERASFPVWIIRIFKERKAMNISPLTLRRKEVFIIFAAFFLFFIKKIVPYKRALKETEKCFYCFDSS